MYWFSDTRLVDLKHKDVLQSLCVCASMHSCVAKTNGSNFKDGGSIYFITIADVAHVNINNFIMQH